MVLTVARMGGIVSQYRLPQSVNAKNNVCDDVSTLASLAMKRRDVRQASWMCLMIPGAGGRGPGHRQGHGWSAKHWEKGGERQGLFLAEGTNHGAFSSVTTGLGLQQPPLCCNSKIPVGGAIQVLPASYPLHLSW